MGGLHVACLVAAGVCWLGAIGALALPGRRDMRVGLPQPAVAVVAREPGPAG